jgi:hypothetical protein
MSRGLLLTMTEPPPGMEEEFNAWYDHEHLAERLAIPGFLSAVRWVAEGKPGEGKYLGTYGLESPAVLQSAAYLQRYRNQSPWTRRCLGKAVVFRRWACRQVTPGEAAEDRAAKALFLAIGDVPAQHEVEFNRWYDEEHLPLLAKVPGVLRARRFFDPEGKPRYVAIYHLADERVPQQPAWDEATRTPWARRIDALTEGCEWILRTYRAYTTRAYTTPS